MDFEEEVRELIDCHGECEYLDFKLEDYHKNNKVELVKDLIAFANSHSTRNKYIIIGIKEENNICEEIVGIDKEKVRDEAELQQIIKTYIKEDLVVDYKIVNIDGKDVLAIKIPATNNSNRPFMVKTQINPLKENDILIRKGSTTVTANKRDLEIMFKEDKKSKLIVRTYLEGNLAEKIQLLEINSRIDEYRCLKLKRLKELVNEIHSLKGEDYVFENGYFTLISDDEVKIDAETVESIKEGLKKIEINYEDWIFDFKNVRWKITFGGGIYNLGGKTLYGNEKEKERYWKLKELENYILEYITIKYYSEYIKLIYSANFVISNVGSFQDEDIELKLIIDKNIFVGNDIYLFDESIYKYLGNMYKDLNDVLIKCPRVSDIDEYYYPILSDVSAPAPSIPHNIGYMYEREETYLDIMEGNAEEFKDEIDNLFVDSIYEENDKVIIKVDFRKIMQNKSMFLESKLLFNTDKVRIDYEIRSKNHPDIIYGTIES